MNFSTLVYNILFFTTRYVKTLSNNNYLLNYFVRCDDPSSHFSTVAMKIENRLSTLTNKIKENLSLLGDGCSLLTAG
jgi:hypothetical protein